jgi:aspartate dehydrogenase
MPQAKIGMIGCGAIGTALRSSLAGGTPPIAVESVLLRDGSATTDKSIRCFRTADEFIDSRPTLVVECAGHDAVRDVVPKVLRSGIDTIVLSIGSFADAAVLDAASKAAMHGGARMIAATGAIGGIDALRSARAAGLTSVRYVGRKPPAAWLGSPAAELYDLTRLKEPAIIFEGEAAAAASLYPKNANVTAAVALAGVGFSQTKVTLVADPGLTRNVHEVEAAGAFGSLRIELHNEALPGNPRSSWLAALNAEYLIRREIFRLEF